MAHKGCITFLKVILCVVNFLFLLIGLLMLAFGIALKAFAKQTLSLISQSVSQQVLDAIPQDILGVVGICMIVLGSVVIVISVLGFFGAICKQVCMLITYAIIVIVILLAEVALIVFVAGFPATLQSLVQGQLQKTLITNFATQDLQITNNSFSLPSDSNGKIWAGLQFVVGCCAISGPSYYSSNLSPAQRTENWPTGSKLLIVPVSCCKKNGTSTVPSQMSDFTNFDQCTNPSVAITDPSINQVGCYQGISQLISSSSQIPIGIAAGTIALQMVLVIVASCMAHFIRKDNDE